MQHSLEPLLPNLNSSSKLKWGERVPVIGQMETTVCHEVSEKKLPPYVVAGNGPTLLRRNWLEYIKLDWQTISQVNAKHPTRQLEALLEECLEIFTEELGTIHPFIAKLRVRSNVAPKFCKARSIPFIIKSAIESKLEHLESCGILEKVDYSEWVAPIVAVAKKDGKFRICGDYKFTFNQALHIDQYPLPKPENLSAMLAAEISSPS